VSRWQGGLACARAHTNAASVVVFLHRLVDVFKHYFEVSVLRWQGSGRVRMGSHSRAPTRTVASVVVFLHRLVDVSKHYFEVGLNG
jgi:alpha-beta hydrolase superfamily lysophospholipase